MTRAGRLRPSNFPQSDFPIVQYFPKLKSPGQTVRETETWVRDKEVDLPDDLESSGDFGFTDDERSSLVDEDDGDFGDMSGSGDYDDDDDDDENDLIDELERESDNAIPDVDPPQVPSQPNYDEEIAVQNNEIGHLPSILHNKADQNIFNKTEVLAAVIAGGAVGLLFAVLLILLLVYRMKKKDEGSYDLGKKPIYKKAPTAEIYA
ncbi:hypothetical protein NFI96_027414 [Prochilodus magdalenae]|nr:hypothetical protein NFI96_027414 [Prochilodus magdalenae]